MLTLLEASKEVGKSKQALLKSIQKGTISAQKNAQKKWIIDPAELFRVYPPKKVVGKNDSEVTTKNNDDSLKILLLQKNEALYEEKIEASKKFHELEISLLKERNQELKEELARTNQRLLDQPKQWQEEREKKDRELNKILQEEREKKEQELNKKLKEEQERKELELNKILQEEREKKEQELNKILELQQTKQQEQRKAEQKRQLVFFLILLILSAGLFLGLN